MFHIGNIPWNLITALEFNLLKWLLIFMAQDMENIDFVTFFL